MRVRLVSFVALLAAPLVLSAQVLPRVGRRPTPEPAPLPPTGGPIARSLDLQRSRWSVDGYSMFSNIRVPIGGTVANYAAFGGGTHAGYRFADRFTGTVDITSSQFGSPVNVSTAEVGTRFMPTPFDVEVRPFFDLRASYLYMNDNFSTPAASTNYLTTRYGNGFGAIAGGGFEYFLTNSFALSTELTAMRGRMTAYSSSNPTAFPVGASYWTTTYRLALGLRYSQTRRGNLVQKPH
jgi:hypothetical protein